MSFNTSTGEAVETHSVGVQPIRSLSAVSALGAGLSLDGVVSRTNAVATVTTSAGVSAGSVVLEGSLDGTNYVTLGSAVTTSAASTTSTVVAQNVFVRYARTRIATAITGGTITAWVSLAG
ncbi:MAG: hypothetical protein JWR34_1794 [Mycobacterium sp.]|nr:hypothetical protein [Mycobacterium sp.]